VDAFELVETVGGEETKASPTSFVEQVNDGTIVFSDGGDVGDRR
jgi:hypothetical protein